jgi:membrane protein implicated in regulation of membrane protease activity
MYTVFLTCAVVGGTLIVVQFIMTLIGFGSEADADDSGGGAHGGDYAADVGDHDVGGDHGGDIATGDAGADHLGAGHATVGHHDHAADHAAGWFFSMLTTRTLSAAAAFFGLIGLGAQRSGFEDLQVLLMASAAGVAAFFLVGWLMRFMHKLNVDGTVRIERAVGCRGNVYLRVPGTRSGAGKVHVNVLNRTQEYQAITASAELPTGSPIVVVGVVGPDTVEVAPVHERQPL